MTAPAFLATALASDKESALIGQLMNRLGVVAAPNREAREFYDGSHVAAEFGISIPPSMRNLHTVAGWAGTAVDVLEERLDWLGWMSDSDEFGLDRVFAENALDTESGLAHLDALIYGVSFVAVGSGDSDEPSLLVTPQSPELMTAEWDSRRRRLSSAMSVTVNDIGETTSVTLYTASETVTFDADRGMWRAVDRDRHNLGRVPVVIVPNRVRRSRLMGRSEISRAVRYYTDAAARTLLGLEVNREFYNAPQRVGLNVDESMFQDANGDPVSPWQAIMGRVWNIPPNEDGESDPDVKQFPPNSPAPYIDQIKGYAQLLAAEVGIPASYLGFQTDNPSSADAIRAGEARLTKRAERRQVGFGHAWMEVARLALLIRDGAVPNEFDMSVTTHWRDAATPTRAAAADSASKLIASGVLPADSSVTYDRVGLTPAEQRQVQADKRRAGGSAALRAIVANSGANSGVS